VCEMKSGPSQRLYLSVVGNIDVLRVVNVPLDVPHASGGPSPPQGGVGLMTGRVEGLTGGGSVTIQRLMFISTPTSLLSDMCLLPSSSVLGPASLGSSTLPSTTTMSQGGNVSIVGIDRGNESALSCLHLHLQPTAFAPQASSAAVSRRLLPLTDSHCADTTDTPVATGSTGMTGVTDTTDMNDTDTTNDRCGGSVAVDDIAGCCPARSTDGTQPAVAAWLVDRFCGCHPLQFNK
jgi:hypothetical protein